MFSRDNLDPKIKFGMELDDIQDSFERVAEKQKLSSAKSQELIDQVLDEIEQALARIQSDNDSTPSDHKTILTELKGKLQVVGSHNHLRRTLRELDLDQHKHQKLLEKRLPDISKACRNVEFDCHNVNQIIIRHLYRESLFDVADCFIKEAGEPEPITVKFQFKEIHRILEAMKSRNLVPALYWVSVHQARLEDFGSDLQLKLHKLLFADILQNQSREDALTYAKTYLAPLALYHVDEVEKLMGSLLWTENFEMSPYADLMDPIHWENLADELMQTFCILSEQPFRDPLDVVVAAGLEGLPTLLKLAMVMSAKQQEWEAMKELPVPLELGKEFQFHNIFVCQVTREQCSQENPPMLLPCGHVICKQAMNHLSKNSTQKFRCHYCPRVISAARCKQLYL